MGEKRLKFKTIPEWLFIGFIFLGPLGNLLTPYIFPDQFRTYYFLLPFFPLLFCKIERKQLMVFLLFLPFLIYCFFSVIPVEVSAKSNLPFPFFRYFLFLSQFMFVLGASFSVKEMCFNSQMRLYLYSFFISLVVGCLFFIGYYLGFFSLGTVERFSVLTQVGYGLLRFSPGSYPNEYGILSSFVLSVLIISAVKKEKIFSFQFFYIFLTFSFIALVLTTTRAAYLSFVLSLGYIAWKEGCLYVIFKWTVFVLFLFAAILKYFGLNLLCLFSAFFSAEALQTGSIESRLMIWKKSWEVFINAPFFGTGFAAMADIHNVYLQFLFELGVVGISLLLGAIIVVYLGNKTRSWLWSINRKKTFKEMVKTIVWIHVLWFAASNHNLNHHLTWFAIFMSLNSIVEESPAERREILQ